VEDKLQETLETLESKSGGKDGSGDGSGGTTAVVRMKEGIKQLKSETAEMTMRIGVLSASLMSNKLRLAKENLRKNRSKQQQAKAKRGVFGGKNKSGVKNDEDD
jgi:hypothetical protein